MKRVEFVLKTTFVDFKDWLGRHTEDVYNKSFPTSIGRLLLQSARSPSNLDSTCSIEMNGYHAILNKEGSEEWHERESIIRFEVRRLNEERVEVQATCIQSALIPYFDSLLSAIARCWPESQIEDAPVQSIPHTNKSQIPDGEPLLKENALRPTAYGTQESTKLKIINLREIRKKNITQGKVKMGWTVACGRAGISPNTAKKTDPELRAHWYDITYS